MKNISNLEQSAPFAPYHAKVLKFNFMSTINFNHFPFFSKLLSSLQFSRGNSQDLPITAVPSPLPT